MLRLDMIMKRENLFYLMIVLTVLATRTSIKIVPEVHITFSGIIFHHFWIGVILMAVGLLIPLQRVYPKIVLYGFGAGLIADELIFMLLGAGKNKEYWELPSLLGMIILVFVTFPIRQKLINFLLQKSTNQMID